MKFVHIEKLIRVIYIILCVMLQMNKSAELNELLVKEAQSEAHGSVYFITFHHNSPQSGKSP